MSQAAPKFIEVPTRLGTLINTDGGHATLNHHNAGG
jgi:hypothetical protein